MLKSRIIPCLDVAVGRVVKGVNFVDLVDAGDPVDVARAPHAAGADELCFLEIIATEENRGTMFDLVTGTAEQVFMPPRRSFDGLGQDAPATAEREAEEVRKLAYEVPF